MSSPIGKHPDGSNCYTKDCKFAVSSTSTAVVNQDVNAYLEAKEKETKPSQTEKDERYFSQLMQYMSDQIDREEWPEEKYATPTKNLLKKMYEKHGLPQTGRTRAVWVLNEHEVVKIAFNGEGLMASGNEVSASNQEDRYIPVASSRWEVMDGVDVQVMEKVKPLLGLSYKEMPDWVGYVDGAQVGYNKSGELVAYDL
jgi:hypothetical protein